MQERRTRISGKLKKLQDLVPNMDKVNTILLKYVALIKKKKKRWKWNPVHSAFSQVSWIETVLSKGRKKKS